MRLEEKLVCVLPAGTTADKVRRAPGRGQGTRWLATLGLRALLLGALAVSAACGSRGEGEGSSGAAPLAQAGPISFEVAHDPLQNGTTATLTLTAAVERALDPFNAGFILPRGISLASGTPRFVEPVLAGDAPTIAIAIDIPDDGFRREIFAYAAGRTSDAEEFGEEKRLVVNPDGPIRRTNLGPEIEAPVTLMLTSDGPLSRGATVALTIEAVPDIDHTDFRMKLEIPSGVVLLTGVVELGPIAVVRGQPVTLTVTVRLPDDDQERTFAAEAQLGEPGAPGSEGIAEVEMETQ